MTKLLPHDKIYIEREVNNMSLINMRDEIVNGFGKNSIESVCIQSIFNDGDVDYFIKIYEILKKELDSIKKI